MSIESFSVKSGGCGKGAVGGIKVCPFFQGKWNQGNIVHVFSKGHCRFVSCNALKFCEQPFADRAAIIYDQLLLFFEIMSVRYDICF